MKQIFLALLVACAMCSSPLSAADNTNKDSGAMPKVGDLAPDFKMQYFDGHDLKTVSLSDYHGKQQVVLAFYIFAFTGG